MALLGTRQVEKWNQAKTGGRLNASASTVVRDMGRREGSDGMSKRQLVCKSRRGLMAVRCRRHPRSFKSLFAGGCRPLRAIRHNCRRLNIEVVVFNCRRSSSEIVSERETASERKKPNGNGVPAKSAFAAWTRGGIRAGCFWLESRLGFPNRGDFDSTCWLGGGQQECRSRTHKTYVTG